MIPRVLVFALAFGPVLFVYSGFGAMAVFFSGALAGLLSFRPWRLHKGNHND